MIIGRGAINGANVGVFEIDGGSFYDDDTAGNAAVSLSVPGNISVRYALGGGQYIAGSAPITFRTTLNLDQPIQLDGIAHVEIAPYLLLSRGQHTGGGAVVTFQPLVEFSRKAALLASATIDISVGGMFDRPFISTWDTRRRFYVAFDHRSMYVAPEPRQRIMLEEESALERQKDRVIE